MCGRPRSIAQLNTSVRGRDFAETTQRSPTTFTKHQSSLGLTPVEKRGSGQSLEETATRGDVTDVNRDMFGRHPVFYCSCMIIEDYWTCMQFCLQYECYLLLQKELGHDILWVPFLKRLQESGFLWWSKNITGSKMMS